MKCGSVGIISMLEVSCYYCFYQNIDLLNENYLKHRLNTCFLIYVEEAKRVEIWVFDSSYCYEYQNVFSTRLSLIPSSSTS